MFFYISISCLLLKMEPWTVKTFVKMKILFLVIFLTKISLLAFEEIFQNLKFELKFFNFLFILYILFKYF